VPAQRKNNINLLPRDEFDRSFFGQFLAWALSYGRYIIIITQIVVLSVFFLRFKLDREHTDLKEAIAQKQAIIASVNGMENDIKSLQIRISDIKNLEQEQDFQTNVFAFLSQITPPDLVFKDLHITRNQIGITANSLSLKSFGSFLTFMKKSDKFLDISLGDIIRNAGVINFKIDANIKPGAF